LILPSKLMAKAFSAVTPFLAAIIALGLNEAAFMVKVIRGGMVSVESRSLVGLPYHGSACRISIWFIS
jgi:ABC-type amino acid transport system permease subunit